MQFADVLSVKPRHARRLRICLEQPVLKARLCIMMSAQMKLKSSFFFSLAVGMRVEYTISPAYRQDVPVCPFAGRIMG